MTWYKDQPSFDLPQIQQAHMAEIEGRIQQLKGGEIAMKNRIAVVSMAVLALVAGAIAWNPLMQSASEPLARQMGQVVEAKEVIAQAEQNLQAMPENQKQELDKLLGGNVGRYLAEAKQAENLKLLTTEEVEKLSEQVISHGTIKITTENKELLSSIVKDQDKTLSDLHILTYSQGEDEVILGIAKDKTPVFVVTHR